MRESAAPRYHKKRNAQSVDRIGRFSEYAFVLVIGPCQLARSVSAHVRQPLHLVDLLPVHIQLMPVEVDVAVGIVRVLQRQGLNVYVPPSQRTSGIPALQYGDVESARRHILWNFEIAAELVREGFTIVTTEPSAAIALRDDAQHLIQDAALAAVAERTFEFSEYMSHLAERGRLHPFVASVPLTIGYHEPCHLRALEPRASISGLLRRIPGLRVVDIDLGCSGMAVTVGLRADRHAESLRSGAAMLARLGASDVHAGTTQCGSCRMQMEEATGKSSPHPAKLMAIAYGLVADPTRLFQPARGGLLA